MNQFLKIIIFSLLFGGPFTVCSQSFVEGTHYSRIKQDAKVRTNSSKDRNEVVEYFSFSCPGCYAIEPTIKALVETRPNLTLRQVHMPFGGAKAKFSQKAFVLMTLLNAQEHRDSIFHRIHVKRNTFDSEDEIIDFFQSLGFERSQLETVLSSFAADTMVRKMNQEAVTNQIRSVPTIIVNNTYQVNVRAVNTKTDLAALVKYLEGQP